MTICSSASTRSRRRASPSVRQASWSPSCCTPASASVASTAPTLGLPTVRRTHDFFASLVAKKFATSYAAAHRRAHIYHVHSKPLYAAIREPNNRNRKPVTLARAIERLMVLDTVLGERRLEWLGAERDKVEYFSTATSLRLKELPHLVFGAGPDKTIRTSRTSCRWASRATVAPTCSCTS